MLIEWNFLEEYKARKQIFAAKYIPYPPAKEELKRELNLEDFEKK